MEEGRITQIQCLKLNAEKEMKLAGMQRVMEDFDEQHGFNQSTQRSFLIGTVAMAGAINVCYLFGGTL